ncbi:SDR family oxidoreductase [Alphaproteobacteria bacterium]|nr:SDR family oxidoreductase [Alphaproteobacteria bacterium]
MCQNIKDKIVLITGASSGLGKQFAQTLSLEGAIVILAARDKNKLQVLSESLKSKGGKVFLVSLDVRSPESIENCIQFINEKLGRLDVLINNAGISIEKYIIDNNIDDYNNLMETNLRGSWLVAKYVGQYMIKEKISGKIINITSVLGKNVIPMLSLYSMSKAAILQMTKSMALEWSRYNIKVNALSPGFIETPMNKNYFLTERGKKQILKWPGRKLGHPNDLEGVILFLCGDYSSFINGSEITIDDGQSLKGL